MNQLITYKIKYTSEYDFTELRKQYSSAVRLVYNKLVDNKEITDKELRLLFKEPKYNNLDLLKPFHIANVISEAKGLFKKHEGKCIVFGSKRKLKDRAKGLITKEEFKENRIRSFNICGEKQYKGNRHFKLDIENNSIIYKQDRKNHYILNLSGLSKKRKKQLLQLQKHCNIKKNSFAISVGKDEIKMTFEPKKERIKLFNNRYIGIDLNPDNIGVSVIVENEIVYTVEYNYKNLLTNITSSKEASNSRLSKYNYNKLIHETYEIATSISNIQKHWHCKFVFVEDLKFKKENNLGRKTNRKVKNLWLRNKFISTLTKHVEISGGKVFTVNPAYTSVIGNLCYDFIDSINASIEIARRGYEVIIKKNKKFYPDLTVDLLKNQWKEYLTEEVMSWKELFKKIKNTKLRYRVSLDDLGNKYESSCLKSIKSFVDLYSFNGKYIGLNKYIVA